MIASNAISQHSTDSAALDACIAAGAGSCGGVAYNPGVTANIQWSARGTGSTFTMAGVTFYPFTGCRRRRQLTQAEQDEMEPAYQATLPSGDWWKDAYMTWAGANSAPALPPYQRRLNELEAVVDPDMSEPFNEPSTADLSDDHRGPWAGPVVMRKKPRVGPLWGMGVQNPNDRM